MASTRSAPARPAPQGPARRKAAAPRARRYAVVHDIDGPRVRLGMLWFVVALGALIVGPLATAALYGTTAAIAAAQTARTWRRRRHRPNEIFAAAMAGATGLGACLGAGGAGLGILAGVALALVGATGDRQSKQPLIANAGWTIQCALAPGLAAASVVLLARLDQGSAIALLLLVSAFDTGDFLIGSGSRNRFEGPIAGFAAILVVTFIVSTLPISALDFDQAWLFGGLVAILAPAGQLLASALLPDARAPASALRRLDSMLLAAPVWCWGVGLVI
jgi:hypothetical protein